ncbi:MAG: methylmalonyl Co-A mutase-associated GTPase MeaB, partial [Alphaproteobacteria bacterium]
PGVGKSTLIEALGTRLTAAGHRVAVLAIDPSSERSGGSILGDKTRMERLANDPNAFIRPSPAAGVLGGVARATRESLLLCEAAGFDIVIVETVGTGQSETLVADMVDVFLVLLQPGGGDDLQGLKKGVLELADILVVTKADQDPERARRSARDYKAALRIVTPPDAPWRPEVIIVSARTGEGLDRLGEAIATHRRVLAEAGLLEARRRRQQVKWMWALLEDALLERFRAAPQVAAILEETERAVAAGERAPAAAAEALLEAFLSGRSGNRARASET